MTRIFALACALTVAAPSSIVPAAAQQAAPATTFTAAPSQAAVGTPVTFTLTIMDPAAVGKVYAISFGDGAVATVAASAIPAPVFTGATVRAVHAFASPGIYAARARRADAPASAGHTARVVVFGPTVPATASPTGPPSPAPTPPPTARPTAAPTVPATARPSAVPTKNSTVPPTTAPVSTPTAKATPSANPTPKPAPSVRPSAGVATSAPTPGGVASAALALTFPSGARTLDVSSGASVPRPVAEIEAPASGRATLQWFVDGAVVKVQTIEVVAGRRERVELDAPLPPGGRHRVEVALLPNRDPLATPPPERVVQYRYGIAQGPAGRYTGAVPIPKIAPPFDYAHLKKGRIVLTSPASGAYVEGLGFKRVASERDGTIPAIDDAVRFTWREVNPGVADAFVVRFTDASGKEVAQARVSGAPAYDPDDAMRERLRTAANRVALAQARTKGAVFWHVEGLHRDAQQGREFSVETSEAWPLQGTDRATGLGACDAQPHYRGAESTVALKHADGVVTLTGKLDLRRSPYAASYTTLREPRGGHAPIVGARFDNVLVDWGDGAVEPLLVRIPPTERLLQRGAMVDFTAGEAGPTHRYAAGTSPKVRVYQIGEESANARAFGADTARAYPIACDSPELAGDASNALHVDKVVLDPIAGTPASQSAACRSALEAAGHITYRGGGQAVLEWSVGGTTIATEEIALPPDAGGTGSTTTLDVRSPSLPSTTKWTHGPNHSEAVQPKAVVLKVAAARSKSPLRTSNAQPYVLAAKANGATCDLFYAANDEHAWRIENVQYTLDTPGDGTKSRISGTGVIHVSLAADPQIKYRTEKITDKIAVSYPETVDQEIRFDVSFKGWSVDFTTREVLAGALAGTPLNGASHIDGPGGQFTFTAIGLKAPAPHERMTLAGSIASGSAHGVAFGGPVKLAGELHPDGAYEAVSDVSSAPIRFGEKKEQVTATGYKLVVQFGREGVTPEAKVVNKAYADNWATCWDGRFAPLGIFHPTLAAPQQLAQFGVTPATDALAINGSGPCGTAGSNAASGKLGAASTVALDKLGFAFSGAGVAITGAGAVTLQRPKGLNVTVAGDLVAGYRIVAPYPKEYSPKTPTSGDDATLKLSFAEVDLPDTSGSGSHTLQTLASYSLVDASKHRPTGGSEVTAAEVITRLDLQSLALVSLDKSPYFWAQLDKKAAGFKVWLVPKNGMLDVHVGGAPQTPLGSLSGTNAATDFIAPILAPNLTVENSAGARMLQFPEGAPYLQGSVDSTSQPGAAQTSSSSSALAMFGGRGLGSAGLLADGSAVSADLTKGCLGMQLSYFNSAAANATILLEPSGDPHYFAAFAAFASADLALPLIPGVINISGIGGGLEHGLKDGIGSLHSLASSGCSNVGAIVSGAAGDGEAFTATLDLHDATGSELYNVWAQASVDASAGKSVTLSLNGVGWIFKDDPGAAAFTTVGDVMTAPSPTATVSLTYGGGTFNGSATLNDFDVGNVGMAKVNGTITLTISDDFLLEGDLNTLLFGLEGWNGHLHLGSDAFTMSEATSFSKSISYDDVGVDLSATFGAGIGIRKKPSFNIRGNASADFSGDLCVVVCGGISFGGELILQFPETPDVTVIIHTSFGDVVFP